MEACLKRSHDGDDNHDGDHDNGDGDAQRNNGREDNAYDFNLSPDDPKGYTYRMTYGLALAARRELPEDVPVQAQVLLLTRFPHLTDEQRTQILRDTALPSGYALLDGNTWDGWGRLNLYAAVNGYGSFFRAVKAATLPETTESQGR